ncbi:MAG: hypothetical protein N2C12_02255, partial [Planctomycetales bacterium]
MASAAFTNRRLFVASILPLFCVAALLVTSANSVADTPGEDESKDTKNPAVKVKQDPNASQTVQTASSDDGLHKQLVQSGIDYLRTKGQAENGSFSPGSGPGVTALIITAVMRNGSSPKDPLVRKSLKFLEGFIQKSGGIHAKQSMYRNYETSMAIMCFAEANRQQPDTYDEVIKNADRFIKGLQWDEGEGQDKSSTSYGGAGYGKHNRPDLSNTGIMIDALVAAGNGPDDEAIKKALAFVSQCQNHESEHNTTQFAAKNPDGSFVYTSANSGETKAEWEDGRSQTVFGLRGYGSMTYMGLKSMIYAGLDKSDPRIKAATDWIGKNYSLESNPGLGKQGLFYYYHTFAKTMDALGE